MPMLVQAAMIIISYLKVNMFTHVLTDSIKLEPISINAQKDELPAMIDSDVILAKKDGSN